MINIIIDAIRSVTNPQFFSNEQSYQGEFLAEIRHRLPQVGLPGDAIVQQEYQKRLADHGINIRPDIIVHVPTQVGGNRAEGNFVAFELNKRAGPQEAQEDFENLDTIINILHYPLAIFLNVGSGRTQAEYYNGPFKDRLHCFSTRLSVGHLRLKHAYWHANELIQNPEIIDKMELPN